MHTNNGDNQNVCIGQKQHRKHRFVDVADARFIVRTALGRIEQNALLLYSNQAPKLESTGIAIQSSEQP